MPKDIAIDAGFLESERARAAARRARFEAEAALPPPIPQPKRLAWAGGKIVTSDKREKLLSLIARQGGSPTEAQRRALVELSSPPKKAAPAPAVKVDVAATTVTHRRRKPWPGSLPQRYRSQLLASPLAPWATRLSTCRAFFRCGSLGALRRGRKIFSHSHTSKRKAIMKRKGVMA